jgi:Fur family ferric uptake transcriptional regulator
MTRQRRVILEALRDTTTHPSADQIYTCVRQKLPHISLATVYRNLEALSARGEIQTIAWAGTLKRFDGAVHHHYHILCPVCGRLDDLPLPVDATLDDQAQTVTDFQVTGHRLEFSGICPTCRMTANEIPAGRTACSASVAPEARRPDSPQVNHPGRRQ